MNSRNGGLKVFEKQEFSLHTKKLENDHWLAVRASEDETSDAFGKCIFSVSAYIPSFSRMPMPSCKQHDRQFFCGNDANVLFSYNLMFP